MISPARRAAYASLRAIHGKNVDLGTAIERRRRELRDDRDRALAEEITYGTLRWRGELDHAIAWAGQRAIGAFDAEVLDLLRMSAYQLLHLDRVPHSAIVDDAVNLCKAGGKASASGAVNAILRHISRDRRRIPMPAEDRNLDFLAISLSHPRWLAERWIARLGFDTACKWARFNNDVAPMTLRANRLKTTRDELSKSLAAVGVAAEPTRFAPDGLTVVSGNPLRTALAAAGLFVVQDESSQLVAAFAGVRAGEFVFDACAAPGGKTTQMAADAGTGARIVACDLRPRRVRLLSQTLKDMGAEGVRVVSADLITGAPFGAIFDCVVVDAPCSGLATVRRDPDIKWRREEPELAGLAERQLRMLSNAAANVGQGGRLVYSTCSSEPEEDEQVIAAFLATNHQFVLEPVGGAGLPLPERARECVDATGYLHPTPHQHDLEPFFAARLRRIT